MNVAPQTFVSPRSCFLITAFTTEPAELSTLTSAGYSQSATQVNASDRPQSNTGHGSSEATASTVAFESCPKADAPSSTPSKTQKACFRADLMMPYGQVFC